MSSTVKAAYWLMDEECMITDGIHKVSSADDIDSTLFTHIICSFTDLFSVKSKLSEFAETVRNKNKEVQLLISTPIKDPNLYSMLALKIKDPDSLKSDMKEKIMHVRSEGFDGVDLDWQYPSDDVQMRDLGKLLKIMRSAIEEESLSTKKRRLLLTATVFCSPEYKTFRYPVDEIVESVDWVNLNFFGFYDRNFPTTVPIAALFDPSNSNPEGLSGQSGLNQWLEAGLPENKAVFGFSYAGCGYELEDVNNHGYGAPIKETGNTFIPYANINKYILARGAAKVHDPIVVGDYCYLGQAWASYDDKLSIVTKVTYAHKRGLRGYFAWHLGADYMCDLSRAAYQAWDAEETAITKN